MKCPSCNKFAALTFEEPEVNEVSMDADADGCGTVTADVHIVRNSECCGDEMKTYDFNTEVDIPDDIAAKIKAIKAKEPEADFEAEESGIDQLEEGGGRYAKSYFGYNLTVAIKHGDEELGTVELTDKCAASEMDEAGVKNGATKTRDKKMSNMSYCRFENTLSDLVDCKYALENVFNGEQEERLSETERRSAIQLVEECEEIAARIREELGLDIEEPMKAEEITLAINEANERLKSEA